MAQNTDSPFDAKISCEPLIAYAKHGPEPLPLFLLGTEPTRELRDLAIKVPRTGRVEFVVRPSSEVLDAAYSAAAALLFPSHAEGFGWPILEAMACGCPVLTTGDVPMTEVGGDVAHYLPAQTDGADGGEWAAVGARRLGEVLACGNAKCAEGVERARQFGGDVAMRSYLAVYQAALDQEVAK